MTLWAGADQLSRTGCFDAGLERLADDLEETLDGRRTFREELGEAAL